MMNSMRPSSIRLHWVRVPFWEPFRISNGEVSVKDAILVQIEAGGTIGWGEASPSRGLLIPEKLRKVPGTSCAIV